VAVEHIACMTAVRNPLFIREARWGVCRFHSQGGCVLARYDKVQRASRAHRLADGAQRPASVTV